MCDSTPRGLHRRVIEIFCSGIIVVALLGPVHGEGPPTQTGVSSLPTAESSSEPTPAATPITTDPFIKLRGAVWRTKAGIVFLKTPIGLLTLSSKTTLKDLKASQEVRFWVHERHAVVEIRKRADGSLVHRYLSGPMTSEADAPGTLRRWGPEGDETIRVSAEENRLAGYKDGDPLTVEVDDTNTLRGVHDLQYDIQVSQTPPAGADVQVLLSGTVSKLKSNFVFVRTPIGLVMLNSKIGIPRVKVGQPLTLRIDREHVTVTVPSTEAAVPRRSVSPAP
jgi:hypothetical protein